MTEPTPSKPSLSGARVSAEDVEFFRTHGFLKINGFFPEYSLDLIRERVDVELGAKDENFQEEFSRIKYDFESPRDVTYALIAEPWFQKTLAALTGRDLFLTHEIGFEVARDVSRGFPWHVGVQSFGYQRSEDFGCTIWTPLQPIDAARHGGGLACISKAAVSGHFIYDQVEPQIVAALSRKVERGEAVDMSDYFGLRSGILNSPAMTTILEELKYEPDFEPGDVLVFDKYVVHRSVPLRAGPLDRRAAFVMRFVENGSRYDRQRAVNLDFPTTYLGYRNFTASHMHICERDGDPITESSFFDQPEKRWIRATARS